MADSFIFSIERKENRDVGIITFAMGRYLLKSHKKWHGSCVSRRKHVLWKFIIEVVVVIIDDSE